MQEDLLPCVEGRARVADPDVELYYEMYEHAVARYR